VAAKNIVVIRSRNAYNAADEFWQGAPVAVITDARDLGVQLYANDAGSMYFTLPVDHPALPLIDPINQHYVVQRWNGSSYDTIQSGFITDYDASPNEVVISGVDYMTTLNKYYTPIHGPELGAKAIPNTDLTPILSTTPKAIIDAAISKDRLKASESYAVSVTNSSYANVGKIAAYSGSAQSGANPSGTRDAITATYEESGGVKTGTVILSGALYIWRSSAANAFQDGETGEVIEGNFSIGTSSTAKGKIGFIISSSPGGPLARVEYDLYAAASNVDLGLTANVPLNFSVKLRPVSNYNSSDEANSNTSATNLNRTMSILSEGVSYEFYITPYYYGNLSPAASPTGTGNVDYNQYIWGATTRAPESAFTSGLQTNAINEAFSDLFDPNDPGNILDRTGDYPEVKVNITSCFQNNYLTTVAPSGLNRYWFVFEMASKLPVDVGPGTVVNVTGTSLAYFNTTYTITEVSSSRMTFYVSQSFQPASSTSATGGVMTKPAIDCKPLIQFMSIEHLGTPTTTKHPYVTAGQGPVDFMRDLADTEMGSRSDGTKVVFNFYGVPSASPDGKKLSVHHSVSPNPQATLVYPGQIKDFNVTNKRSAKVTSARVIPTTAFLIGSNTEGSSGAKTKGSVKTSSGITSASPALPTVTNQGGFLSADAAGNFAQGIINDFGEDADNQAIRVSLRTEQFGPIGVSGTPKLGETVRVVVRRKNVTVGGDELSGLYNVGGMQWVAKIDGTEALSLDLVKPNKFKGAAITWEQKPASTPAPTPTPYVGRKPPPRTDPAGNELPDPTSPEGMTGAFTGTSYMYPGTSGAPAVPKPPTYSGGNTVGLPRNTKGGRVGL
jgi:hypothetical protein